MSAVPERCLHPPRRGNCYRSNRYRFDETTNACVISRHPACFFTGNHFGTYEDCTHTCNNNQ